MPDPVASLPDMMTALQRADAAGNAGDAKSIAQMISTAYPDHTAALLKASPGGTAGRPPVTPWNLPPGQTAPPNPVTNPAQFAPPVLGQTPEGVAPGTPNWTGPALQANPPGPAPSGGAPAGPYQGQPAPPLPNAAPAVATAPGGNWIQRAGQDLVDFSRSTVAAIPGGAALAGAANALANGQSWDQGEQNFNALAAQSAARSPIASAAGDIYGNAATMMLGGAAAEAGLGKLAASGVAGLAPAAQKAQAVAQALGKTWAGRAVIGAGTGATAGAIDSAVHGGSMSDVLTEAAIGGVTAPIIGAGAEWGLNKMGFGRPTINGAPASSVQGWGVLAARLTGIANSGGLDAIATTDAARAALRTMKVDPAELAQRMADMTAANGGVAPPLATVLDSYAQAQLKRVATLTPTLGNAMTDASNAWEAQGPKQVPGLIQDAVKGVTHDASPTGQAGVQSQGDLTTARDANTTATFNPFRGRMVDIGKDEAEVLQNPAVQSVLAGLERKDLRGRVNDAVNAATTDDTLPPPPPRPPGGGTSTTPKSVTDVIGSNSTMQPVLQHIIDNGADEGQRELARVIKATGLDVPISVLQKGDPHYEWYARNISKGEPSGGGGFYDPTVGKIGMMPPKWVPDDRTAQTVLHEAMHAISYNALSSDNPAALYFNKLHEYAKGLLPTRQRSQVYGLTNPHEFMTEGFANPKFRSWLASQPPPKWAVGGAMKSSNAWDTFKNIVYKLIGATPKARTLFDEVMDTGGRVIDQNPNYNVAGKLKNGPSPEPGAVEPIGSPAAATPKGALSLHDLDLIRKNLRERASSSDAAAADAARQAHSAISEIARRDPEYSAMLDQHAKQSAYIEGHAHGLTGKPIGSDGDSGKAAKSPFTGDAYRQGHASGLVTGLSDQAAGSVAGAQTVLQKLGQDNLMRDSLTRAYGKDVADKLAATGERLSKATAAMREGTPNGPTAGPAKHIPTDSIGHAAIGAITGNHHALLYNTARAIQGLFGPKGLSSQAGAKLANMLTDPSQAANAIAILKRQGVADDQIARITGYVSGIGGASTAHQVQAQAGL